MKKIAVVLFNLGGPDSKESIRPFLFNFFMDRNIVRLPHPFRFLLALYISITRARGAAGGSYAHLGYKSPLLENSRAQAEALEKVLNAPEDPGFRRDDDIVYKVFISMRYWHPMAGETARAVKDWGADEIVLLPLYPQFSTTTTRSSFQAWKNALKEINFNPPSTSICCYPLNEGFIAASADNIRAVYERALKDGHASPRILFSAHGLPESVIRDGDPYQWQCERSAEKIIAALGLESPDWSICYQSRVGRQKWIGPSTEEELRRAARDKKAVIIYPVAFTQEHVETLVEIEIEYRELAHELGVPGFYRVPTVSASPAFIDGLAAMVTVYRDKINSESGGATRLCASRFTRCSIVGNLSKTEGSG